jgi:hypothetical protein
MAAEIRYVGGRLDIDADIAEVRRRLAEVGPRLRELEHEHENLLAMLHTLEERRRLRWSR